MALQVVGHRLMIKPDAVEKEHQVKGSDVRLILAKDERLYREATSSGTVVQVGPNAFFGFGDNKPWCSAGDSIIYARHTGKFIKDPETEEEFYIINDEDVQVVITKKE